MKVAREVIIIDLRQGVIKTTKQEAEIPRIRFSAELLDRAWRRAT
jgi:hypothetical protein